MTMFAFSVSTDGFSITVMGWTLSLYRERKVT